ncbi:MAG TPA: mannose-6-phosphate isomerase [Balneolaceae bacterium]|nr:mannose-6-phosphate isomerase [Balneolaceae bacterium]|tara:strand:+ start:139041 stop:140024 length:984 start_codon:yes stop_codon:yes gene_type:complete
MSSIELYPLKFDPILKEKIWGGTKLGTVLDKPTGDSENMGESWEISGVEGNISVVSEGDLKGRTLVELINEYKGELIGEHVYEKFGDKFPLLIKFIDANDDLSIQVHPDDELAQKRHNSFGKTEMWYVVDAEEGATLISGFKKQTNKEEYLRIFEEGNLTDILNSEDVVNDDVFFLPAGRVHTIGKGLLIAEIQQTSDITYRIYDFDRVDKNGVGRELHVEEAVDAIDYSFYENYKTSYDRSAKIDEIGRCQYFVTNRLLTDELIERDYSDIDSCIILMCLQGSGTIDFDGGSVTYELGDSILIPNSIKNISIDPSSNSKLLEVKIP